MRKFFWIFLFSGLLLTGCHKHETVPVSNTAEIIEPAPETAPDFIESASETAPESETQPTFISFAERAEFYAVAETPHIYDECGELTAEQAALHNNYLEQLSSTRCLNAFVVITNHINGSTPQHFAQEYYQAVADAVMPDGFLLLINNDTNQDYIFTTGRCSSYIPPSEAELLLSGATSYLIEGNYDEALHQIFSAFETIPVYFTEENSGF